MESITARVDQDVTLTPVFKDSFGNVVTVLGSVPAWSVSDAALATLVVAQDGLSAVVKSTGQVGGVDVTVTADADPDADIENVSAVEHIDFTPGKATVAVLSGVVSDSGDTSPPPPPPPPTGATATPASVAVSYTVGVSADVTITTVENGMVVNVSVSGAVPPGLSFSRSNNVFRLAGTPTEQGTYNVSLVISTDNGTVTVPVTITVWSA